MSIDKITTQGNEIIFPSSNENKTEASNVAPEKFKFPPIHDINDISSELRHYFQPGIDINNSFSNLSNNSFNFQLNFHTRQNESVSFSGDYFLHNSSLKTNINFSFEKLVEEDGKIINKRYDFAYNLEAENIFEYKKDKTEEKEDILSFIKRVSHKVFELAEDDDLKLRSIYLDKEDLKDIIFYEDDKGRRVLMELVNLVILTARLKQSQNKKEEELVVDYHPERKKTEKEETSIFKVNKFNVSLDIKETNLSEKSESDSE